MLPLGSSCIGRDLVLTKVFFSVKMFTRVLFCGVKLMLTAVFFRKVFLKNTKFCPLGVLTKVFFSVKMLTIVLFCGKKLMLTKVFFIADTCFSGQIDSYGGVSV